MIRASCYTICTIIVVTMVMMGGCASRSSSPYNEYNEEELWRTANRYGAETVFHAYIEGESCMVVMVRASVPANNNIDFEAHESAQKAAEARGMQILIPYMEDDIIETVRMLSSSYHKHDRGWAASAYCLMAVRCGK